MPGKKDRKRDRDSSKGASKGGLGSMGMFGMPEMPSEDDLEAELLALTGGKSTSKGSKKPKGAGNMSMADIDKMMASVKDIGEGDDDDDDDQMSGEDIDEDDLLAELQDLQNEDIDDSSEPDPLPVAPAKPTVTHKPASGDLEVVESRLRMYQSAIAAAKEKNESAKVRRYERSLKTLNEMMKSVKAGKKVNMEDIPPEVLVTGGVASKAATQPAKTDEEDMSELQSWITADNSDVPATKQPVATPTATPNDVITIQSRLKMYEDAIKSAESQGESGKVRRYKRALGTLQDALKTAKSGRSVNMDELPPPVSVSNSKPKPEPEPRPKPAPEPRPQPSRPGNLIDLDAPEFDEFNLSEEDMASLMSGFVDDRQENKKDTPIETTPTSQPKPSDAPVRPPGLIDLDGPEFAEFDLSEADLEALSSELVDDRTKGAKQETTPPKTTPPSGERPTQSLPSKPTPTQPNTELTKEIVLSALTERKDQYMKASHDAKSRGDEATRKQYGLVAVNFKRAIEGVKADSGVDLRGIPPPPPGFTSRYNIDLSSYGRADSKPHPPQETKPQPAPQQDSEEGSVDSEIPIPKTPLEALTQRLDKYKEGLKNAQDKGESSRVRRTGRIIKQYEDAIKLTKAGKPCDYNELPTPPGYPPIPATPGPRPQQAGPRPQQAGARPQPSPSHSLPAKVPTKLTPSVSDRQLQTIQERGSHYMAAVKQAKAKGDKDKALLYLKYYKSIQQMLQAAQGGLPVDLSQLPPSPFSDPSKATANKDVLSHLGPAKEGDDKTFDLIEQQLEQQIEVCKTNGEMYQKLGNLAASSQYKNMSDQCQRDLLAIKGIRSQGLAPPKFTMEIREFAIVHSHPEISDKLMEVEVVRGITVPAPSGYTEGDMNMYIDVEFPWPSDSPQKHQTKSIKESSNPEFNETCSFDIDRKQTRSLQRVFKRQPIKFMIYQYRMLRKDIFIGMVSVSLEALEKKCDLHVTEDIKDEKGRKPVGGKLEVKVRLREPLSGRDQEVKNQKWLVFQESIATESSVRMLQPQGGGASGGAAGVTSPMKVEQTTSLEALKLELSIVQNAVKAGKKDQATIQRGQAIQSRIKVIKQKLQDPGFKREYMSTIMRELKMEKVIEQQLVQAGRTSEAKVVQGRRKMMENELSKLQK